MGRETIGSWMVHMPSPSESRLYAWAVRHAAAEVLNYPVESVPGVHFRHDKSGDMKESFIAEQTEFGLAVVGIELSLRNTAFAARDLNRRLREVKALKGMGNLQKEFLFHTTVICAAAVATTQYLLQKPPVDPEVRLLSVEVEEKAKSIIRSGLAVLSEEEQV